MVPMQIADKALILFVKSDNENWDAETQNNSRAEVEQVPKK